MLLGEEVGAGEKSGECEVVVGVVVGWAKLYLDLLLLLLLLLLLTGRGVTGSNGRSFNCCRPRNNGNAPSTMERCF